jgi:hypothetical protein
MNDLCISALQSTERQAQLEQQVARVEDQLTSRATELLATRSAFEEARSAAAAAEITWKAERVELEAGVAAKGEAVQRADKLQVRSCGRCWYVPS